MTVVNQLYKSSRYDFDAQTFSYESRVADLVRELEREAAARGYTLSRWQANRGGHRTTITYAVHTGERRAQFRLQPEGSLVAWAELSQAEGTTERCEAFRVLRAVLEALVADARAAS